MFKKVVGIVLLCVACSPPVYQHRKSFKTSHYAGKPQSYKNSVEKRRHIVRTATKYIGTRYKSGGTTPRGFDCSGFVMYVYLRNGIHVPRSARKQFYEGERVRFRYAYPGDLIFFETQKRKVSHVGIYLGNLKFIHAPSSGKHIRVDTVKNRYWKKRYIGTVRYISSIYKN